MGNSKLLICSVFLFFSFLISFVSSSYFNTTLTTTTHKCSPLLLFKQNLSSFNFSTVFSNNYYDLCGVWLGSEGYYPIMMNWNTSIDCCQWDGVTCDHSTGDVIGLDLSCGMLQGTLHPNNSLFNLPNLQSLNLAFNDFIGSKIPREIGRFSNSLTHLNISQCGFSGQVPTDITLLHKLVSLDLSQNPGLGLEPRVFINLLQNYTSLEQLSLQDVNISSVLPAHLNISSSSSLKLLNFGATTLHGKLPNYIFNLQSLEKLDLGGNYFTGQIPWEFSLLPKLVSLDLSFNDNLRMKPHIFNNHLQNSTLLRYLRLDGVNIGLVLPAYLNISSSSLKSLYLMNTGLKGKLPDNIFSLQYLEELDLSLNTNLNGPLPRVNATIPPLKYLHLSGTNLSGEMPDSVGHFKSLIELDLSNCNFMGPLPKSIVNLRHLTSLNLSSNKLKGTLPSSLFYLPSLKQLSLDNNQFDMFDKGPMQTGHQLNLYELGLSYNNFSGDLELDTLLSSLTNLGELRLSYSGLSVTTSNANHHVNPDYLPDLYLVACKIKVFPEFLRSMRSLSSLNLSNNEIHGQIPHWAGEIGGSELVLDLSHNFITGLSQLPYGLRELYLQSNLIQGPFPPSICNMSDLSTLDLSNNEIHGQIPHWAGEIGGSELVYLDLSHKFITGLSQLPYGLRELYLQSNLIQGPFPPSICNMSDLSILDLSNNRFDGVIPQCIGNLTSSVFLMNLGNNHFQGSIPNVFENCRVIEGLILNGNQLDGEVPDSLSKCQSLNVLDMGNNHLNGTFPYSLGSLPNLQVLILKSNNFHGPIVPSSSVRFPFPTLQVIDLSHNRFEGQLPRKYFQNFNAMKNGVERSIEPEYLIDIPSSYSIIVFMKGGVQALPQVFVGYKIVCLSHNQFDREIPDNIGNLNFLIVLDLSHNRLTGQIPHALGKLSQIESLDLSWNQLTGKIPQSLADLKWLEFLNLSQNHLVGLIPAGKQFNTFEGNLFEGNPSLCGFPLPKKCNENPHDPHLEDDGEGDEEESGFTWRVVMLGYGCGTLFGLVMGYLMLSTGRPMWFNAIADVGEQMILKRRNRRRYIYIGR